jgi:hypothetical protein
MPIAKVFLSHARCVSVPLWLNFPYSLKQGERYDDEQKIFS